MNTKPVLRRINLADGSNTIDTIAGWTTDYSSSGEGDGAQAQFAKLGSYYDCTINFHNGTLYFGEDYSKRIRAIPPGTPGDTNYENGIINTL